MLDNTNKTVEKLRNDLAESKEETNKLRLESNEKINKLQIELTEQKARILTLENDLVYYKTKFHGQTMRNFWQSYLRAVRK